MDSDVTKDKVEAQAPMARCPKCGHGQAEGSTCDRCGLDLELAARSDAERPWEVVPEGKEELIEELETRWADLQEHFDDEERHRKLVAYAGVTGLVDQLARRYRIVLESEEDEARRQLARAAMEQLVEVMHAHFVANRGTDAGELWEQRATVVKRAIWVIVVLMCLGVIALTFYVVRPF